jgi:hypothetical protein
MKHSDLFIIMILLFSCRNDDHNGYQSDMFDFNIEGHELVSFEINDDWNVHIQYPTQAYFGGAAIIYYAFIAKHETVFSEKPTFTLTSDKGKVNTQYNDSRIILIQDSPLGEVNLNFFNDKRITFNVINNDEYFQDIITTAAGHPAIFYAFIKRDLCINEEVIITFYCATPYYTRQGISPILLSGSADLTLSSNTMRITPRAIGDLKIKVFDDKILEFTVANN